MSQLTLLRHGQANTGARDEESYDQLSDLGWKQARWLGEEFAASGEVFARFYSGQLRRHRETAEALALSGHADPVIDPRFNELEYFTLAQLLKDQHGVAIPTTREEFTAHLPRLFNAWHSGQIENPPESFDDFEARVKDGMEDLSAGDGRAIVVSSTGVIGMAMRVTMGLDTKGMARACLAVENTSVSRWTMLDGSLALSEFNTSPHLSRPERQFARTHL